MYKYLVNKRNIKIFMDSINKADDNAEHLYRFFMRKNEKNIYFILDKNSPHWQRLKSEGFNLVDYKSFYYIYLLFICKYYISSHLPKYGYSILKKFFKKLFHFKIVFLQHGVTHNDISHILKKHNIDLLITATFQEHSNFLNNKKYSFIKKEKLLLSGFPRYDELLNKNEVENTILVFPTWRAAFTEHFKNNKFSFINSSFQKNWNSFFNSQKLEYIVTNNKYKLIIILHPELVKYLNKLNIPNYIEICEITKINVQSYLKKAKFMITDYSSLAFDMAIQKKAVCYYQFDSKDFYKHHLYDKCYYNYKKNGFGDVSYNLDDLLISINKLIINNGKLENKYIQIIEKTFPFFDNFNSKRVYNAIQQL